MSFQLLPCPAQDHHDIVLGQAIPVSNLCHRLSEEIAAHEHISVSLRQCPNKIPDALSKFFGFIFSLHICLAGNAFCKFIQDEDNLTAATLFRSPGIITVERARADMERELFADVRLAGFPARQFQAILNDLSNVLGTYDKLNHRNKKDENHLNKHAMHLIRLYLMCIDILEKEDIITYREKDHDLLMSIRGGAYQKEDGTYRKEFFDLLNEYEKRMKYAEENTSLPASPDMKKIEEFVEEVNLESLQH